MHDLRNRRVTVMGLGHFGGQIAVTRWLVEQGAKVLVTDREPAGKLVDSVAELEGLAVSYRLGEHRREDFIDTDLVVTTPAVPPTNEFLAAARGAGVPITTEIRLFVERCPASIFGVTGTKGKSTTTALLGQMLQTRFKTWVGGNIGKSLLLELGNIGKTDLVVLELSSFMLHHLGEMQWSPHVGVITMLAVDHEKWHGGIDEYIEAKKNILRFQRPDDYAVLNADNAKTRALASWAPGQVVLFGLERNRPFELKLYGAHNQINAQGAFAAASILGITWEEAQAAIGDFTGLPHRLHLVHEEKGVKYFDDSIATIPEAAIAALQTFPSKTVIQIVGGDDKGIPFTSMCHALIEGAKAVLCIGKTGPTIAGILGESPSQSAAAVYQCGDLTTAMSVAKKIATAGDIVLLSTGCASYDQFVNFEQRGEMFTALAREARA